MVPDWQTFEELVRLNFKEHFHIQLEPITVKITDKEKRFDLGNLSLKIIGDVKRYTNTKSGKNPSAKRSTANEYVWLLQRFGREREENGEKWRKILVMGEDPDMLNKYVRDYNAWLDDIEIFYFNRNSGFQLARDSKGAIKIVG